jgi:hypothetical protein
MLESSERKPMKETGESGGKRNEGVGIKTTEKRNLRRVVETVKKTQLLSTGLSL